jgi:D-amino-acid dehydrogenase
MAFDAAVIGGGLLGMATAYHLVSAGARTLLVDRADVGRATDAGAGILAPETNSRDPDSWFRLAAEAVDDYPSLIERLRAEQAGDTGYAQCGKLVVAVSDEEIEPFAHARRIIFERQRRRGLPKPGDLHEIGDAEARELFREGSVQRLVREGDRVTGLVVGGDIVHAGAVAIAGGAWSDELGRQFGVTIPVAPQRGQIIHLGLRGTDTSRWPMVSAFRHQYMVPWADSRVVAGATRETGSGFTPHTTSAGVRDVLAEALRVAPGLAGAEIREIRVGLRPLTPDTLPVLGTVPGVAGVFLVTGHGPTGLTLGPYSGRIVAALMLGKTPETDLAPFSVARFAR